MAEIARITAVVTANTTQFTRGMKAADAQTKATAASMRSAGGSAAAVERGMSRVGSSSRVAAAGMKAAKVAMGALAVTAFIGYKEMQKQERVSTNTANTLRNVGNSAGFTVTKIENMSAALARQTGIEDDLIQGSANLLLGFKDIGNNASVFDKVLTAAMDRSAKTGRDLIATTRALGFAYQSPTSGVTMLRRAGVLLTKETQKQIKDLAAAGKLEEARAMLLDKVASSAKGAARELGQTSTGQVNRLRESFNQMAESVAKAVLPALLQIGPPIIEFAQAAAPAFAAVGKYIAAIATPIARMLSGLVQNKAAVIALTAAFAGFIALGIASKVAGIVAAFRALATAGTAAQGLSGRMAMLGRVMPLVTNPIVLMTAAVGAGIAALFLMADRTSYAERQQRALAEASNATTTALTGTTNAVNQEVQALLNLGSSNANATQKAATAAAAQKAYNTALAEGARAGETAAQFQARINGLRQRAVATANAASAAESSNAQQVKSVVAGLDVLTGAYGKNKAAIQAQAATASAMGRNVFATTKNREQAARDMLATEGALSKLDRQRPKELANIISQTKIATQAIKGSTLSDGEKAAMLDKVKSVAANAQSELNKINQTKAKTKVEPPDKTAAERLKEIRREFALLPTGTRTIDVVTNYRTTGTKPTGGFRGGYIAGYAGGGVVRGPGGRDVIPAMLTRGEVVLTKHQQSLVDRGMSIRDAIVRTGGAYKKGGVVDKSFAAGFKFRKQNKNETGADYAKARSEAKKDYIQNKKDAAKQRRSSAVSRFTSAVGAVQGRAISEKFQGGMTGIGLVEQTRRDQEKVITDLEKKFTGTIDNIGEGIGKFSGSFKQFDAFQTKSNRDWERGWTGTIKRIDGSTFTGGLAAFDKKVEEGRAAIERQYSALTASEQALKNLNDEAAASEIAANVADAQKAYDLAVQFGNAKEIADAQKALGRAELEQRRADLEGKAKTEREAADAAKATALSELEANAATERQMLQDKFDDERALRDIAFAEARTALQGQLDAQLQTQRDADAKVLAQLAFQQEQEQAALDRRLEAMNAHFENADLLTREAVNAQIAGLNANSAAMEASGTTLAFSFASGMVKGKPRIINALKQIGKAVEDYLRLRSPAKKGPLSTIDSWFDALAPTLTGSIDTGSIESSLGGMKMNRSGGGGVSINLTVNDSTFAGMSRDQADRVARDIKAALDRQVSYTI